MTHRTMSDEPRIHVELTAQAIDPSALRDWITDIDTGAHAWFEGVTRRMTGDRQTVQLAYEAFVPMATAQLRDLAQQAAAQFELRAITIVHRLGVVPVGQASIVIGCCSAHRVGALAALPWLMDRIKADVAIWKQEQFADGQRQWVHPR
jgi:molybdopterin synthase catalytic subunit